MESKNIKNNSPEKKRSEIEKEKPKIEDIKEGDRFFGRKRTPAQIEQDQKDLKEKIEKFSNSIKKSME